jgi:hypothetical protein
MLDLTSSLTKLEDDLERTINNTGMALDEKSFKVRQLLDKIVSAEASIAKFNSMLIQNNDNTNTQQDGSK